jgi:hypothetical protein
MPPASAGASDAGEPSPSGAAGPEAAAAQASERSSPPAQPALGAPATGPGRPSEKPNGGAAPGAAEAASLLSFSDGMAAVGSPQSSNGTAAPGGGGPTALGERPNEPPLQPANQPTTTANHPPHSQPQLQPSGSARLPTALAPPPLGLPRPASGRALGGAAGATAAAAVAGAGPGPGARRAGAGGRLVTPFASGLFCSSSGGGGAGAHGSHAHDGAPHCARCGVLPLLACTSAG